MADLPRDPACTPTPLQPDLDRTLADLRAAYGDSADLTVRRLHTGGHDFACVTLDNMADKELLERLLLAPLQNAGRLPRDPVACMAYMERTLSRAPEQKRLHRLDQVFCQLGDGFGVLLLNGCSHALAVGVQAFPARGVEPPQNDVMERAAHEAFTEVLGRNVALLRRRVKSPMLTVETLTIGERSATKVAVCYLRDSARPETVARIKRRLRAVRMDMVLESGYLQPFLENNAPSLFSTVGVSERPDTVCAKLSEGRVAVLTDGSPFCLFTPFLFVEHFQSMDDYTLQPAYATLIRLLKMLAFFLAVLLPGLYVAIGEHNPEVFPGAIFFKVIDAEMTTPFSLLWEALIIHTIYEIMREAGLRLPKSVGHAVSIVGALVIGEAAVDAGLIGAPMIIVVAVTALASYVIPSLYYPAAILRFGLIVVGGVAGLFGVLLGFAGVVTAIAAQQAFGVPLLAPLSPFDPAAMRDTFWRVGWRRLARRTVRVQNLQGTDEDA